MDDNSGIWIQVTLPSHEIASASKESRFSVNLPAPSNKQEQVIQEWLRTEESYVADLCVLRDVSLFPCSPKQCSLILYLEIPCWSWKKATSQKMPNIWDICKLEGYSNCSWKHVERFLHWKFSTIG